MSLKDKYQVTNVFVSAVTPENISRQQLLAWVNDSLQSNLTKIEEMSTGAAYCLLTDRLFPGSIPLHKVKWNTKSDIDSIANWKLVQHAWHDLGITKPIHVQVLMKGKFQDNFEFLQWFRRFYDHNNAGYEYDPLAARNNEPFPSSTGIKASKIASRVPAAAPASTNRRVTMLPTNNAPPSKPTPTAASRRTTMAPRPATTAANNAKQPDVSAQLEAKYRAEINELKEQVATWEKTISSVEHERDYYYQRLHKLELLCNDLEPEDSVHVSKILAILYKGEDDGNDLEDFEAVEEKILHETQEINLTGGEVDLNGTFVKPTEANGTKHADEEEKDLLDLSHEVAPEKPVDEHKHTNEHSESANETVDHSKVKTEPVAEKPSNAEAKEAAPSADEVSLIDDSRLLKEETSF